MVCTSTDLRNYFFTESTSDAQESRDFTETLQPGLLLKLMLIAWKEISLQLQHNTVIEHDNFERCGIQYSEELPQIVEIPK